MDEVAGISKPIRDHLASLVRSSGLPDTEETFQRMAAAWLSKKRMFEDQARALDMQELDSLPAGDRRGVLLLTWSGSLVSLEPPSPTERRGEYASVEMRTDVPHLLLLDGVDIPRGLALNQEAEFSAGPLRRTSALLKIVACDPSVAADEQARRIREATIFLTNGFVKINRTVARHESGYPELMTLKSMVAYLAEKNGLSKKRARQLIEDYHTLLQAGILLGQRVPLGKLGKLFLKEQPARKARVGVNPATGQKITIAARPPQPVPRMSFSRLLKERARNSMS